MATVTVTNVDPEVKRALQRACLDAGVSVSEAVRERLSNIATEIQADAWRNVGTCHVCHSPETTGVVNLDNERVGYCYECHTTWALLGGSDNA